MVSIQDDGQQKLSRTTSCFVTHDYSAYFGQAVVGKRELSPKMIYECLTRVPDEDIYPEAPPHITISMTPANGSNEIFVTGPKLRRYS